MEEKFLNALRAIVSPDGLLTSAEVSQRSAGQMRDDMLQAGALVRPRTTQQVAAVLKLCNDKRQPVVTQGGLTSLVHGNDAGPGELILSLERMNAIEEIDPLQRVAVVQAGVTLQALHEAVERFDPKVGVKFETYAIPRIKGMILDELRRVDTMPRSVRCAICAPPWWPT